MELGWQLNGSDINLSMEYRYKLNGGNLVVLNPNRNWDTGSYQCFATNSVGTIVSREAKLQFACKYMFTHLCDSTYIPCKFVYLLLIFKSNIDIFCSHLLHGGRHLGTGPSKLCTKETACVASRAKSVMNMFYDVKLYNRRKQGIGQKISDYDAYLVVKIYHTYIIYKKVAATIIQHLSKVKGISILLKISWKIRKRHAKNKVPAMDYPTKNQKSLQLQTDCRKPVIAWAILAKLENSRTSCHVAYKSAFFVEIVKAKLSYAWIFNEYPSFVEEDSRRFVSQETGHLYIAKVEPLDVGNYTCVVTSMVTNARVLGSPTPLVLRSDGVMGEYEPKIEVQFPETLPAAKGSTVKLECFALGNPVPQINWRRSDGLPFSTKIKLRKSNGVLEIPNFQQEDAGSYECIAENSRGKNVARGRLTYYAKPHWVQLIEDVEIAVEDSLYWECRASGKPKPSYRWLKNGEALVLEERTRIENGALTISNLNVTDSGMFQCIAENKHGLVYSSAELKVVASAPDFSKTPMKKLIQVQVGREVSLDCKPRASPRALSSWKKGDVPVQETERYSVVQKGDSNWDDKGMPALDPGPLSAPGGPASQGKENI
ncbi:hypothetical protein E2I00_011221 [Balaenoptera physalus]|uniref:Ig-like domain-containing protein n=1 Tax=Balaenoptera physalus TaxID=9770 RepID=A0A6A1Q3S3_BALPH|nr:hypothetical protein E2I00_011221 [Balaenoptera physalus]